MRVLIVDGSFAYHALFRSLGFTLVSDLEEADLVCFTGGADVDPRLYDAKKHPATGCDFHRDAREALIFEGARQLNLPMVGICRGGQFLNVMSGGEMYQDVTEHGFAHSLTDLITGETVYVSSTHHQMMKPSKDSIIIAQSINVHSHRQWYEGEVFFRDENDAGNEVVFYPDTKCLCFQPHPEFDRPEYAGMKKYFMDCLTRTILEKVEA